MAERVSRLRRPGRWRWLPSGWVLLSGVALLALAGAAWAVLFSRLLTAEGVTVEGNARLDERRIQRVAQVPADVSLARVDIGAVAARVASIPAIRSVNVSREWPHTVAVRVTERVPVAVLSTTDGIRGIDGTGAVFRLGPRTVRPARWPLPKLVAGQSTAPEAIVEGARVTAALPARLTDRVREVRVRTRDSITLHLRDGDQVVWGSAQDSAEKARVLRALLRLPATVYDVSVPGLPTATGG